VSVHKRRLDLERVNQELLVLEEQARVFRSELLGDRVLLTLAGCWGVWIVHEDGSGECSRGQDCMDPGQDHILATVRCIALSGCSACRDS
jgi:hypothetical protein